MTALQLGNCCCCINLRIGALILGYLGLIGSILEIVYTGIAMAGGMTDEHGHVLEMPAAIGIMTIILFVITLVFYALLLAGVYQRKPSLVKTAWIYMIVYILLDAVLELCNPEYQNAPAIVAILLGFCLGIYFAVCVRSYELVLKEEGLSRPNHGGHA